MIAIARRNRVSIVNTAATAARKFVDWSPAKLKRGMEATNTKLTALEKRAKRNGLSDADTALKNRLEKRFDAMHAAHEQAAKIAKRKARSASNSVRDTSADRNARLKRVEKQNKHLAGFKNARLDKTPEVVRDPLTGARIKDGFQDDPKYGFERSSDFFNAVVYQARNGSASIDDPRLRLLAGTEDGVRTFRNAAGTADGQNTLSDPYGGFLIPQTFLQGLLTTETEGDPFTGTTKLPMNTPSVKVNAKVDKNHTTSVSGGLVVTRRGEAAARNISKMEFEQIEMTGSGLFGLSTATEEMIHDSPASVAALIQSGFNDEFYAKIADEKLNGTGIGGEYEGVYHANHPATLSVFRGTLNRITGIDVLKMRARCWRYNQAVWIANPDAYPDLATACIESPNNAGIIMVMKGSWNSPTDPEMLLGRPIIFTEFAPSFTAAGGLGLVNWSQFLEGTIVGPRFDESIHVRFETAERMFRFYARNCGRSWWRAPLTPKKGANTLSPFVKLAATTS